jgi:hypothetical protein
MSQQELINKYKKQDIEIEYHSDEPGFVTITNKNDRQDVNLKKMNKYFDDIDNLVDNMSNKEFESLLVEAGIESCPYYEE